MVHCTSDGLVDGGLGSIPRLGVDLEVQCNLRKFYPEIGNGSEWCIALLMGWWMVVWVPFRDWVLIPKCSAPYKKSNLTLVTDQKCSAPYFTVNCQPTNSLTAVSTSLLYRYTRSGRAMVPGG